MTLAAIDLFSGGGLSIALKESGFQILFANEIHQSYAKTHKHNFPEVPLIEMDIRDLDEEILLEKTQGIEVDLITGGPRAKDFLSSVSEGLSTRKVTNLEKIHATNWCTSS